MYATGTSSEGSPYFCDDCISSPEDLGCSCNWNYVADDELPEGEEGKDWRWVEYEGSEYMEKITKEEKVWVYLDEKGRPSPCAEYFYDEDGFEMDLDEI